MLRRKREQTASGQHVLHLVPAVQLLLTASAPDVSGEGGAQCASTVMLAQHTQCNTPAGAAEHLRGVRRAVMLARKQPARD
jgi:hypothetical protein